MCGFVKSDKPFEVEVFAESLSTDFWEMGSIPLPSHLDTLSSWSHIFKNLPRDSSNALPNMNSPIYRAFHQQLLASATLNSCACVFSSRTIVFYQPSGYAWYVTERKWFHTYTSDNKAWSVAFVEKRCSRIVMVPARATWPQPQNKATPEKQRIVATSEAYGTPPRHLMQHSKQPKQKRGRKKQTKATLSKYKSQLWGQAYSVFMW